MKRRNLLFTLAIPVLLCQNAHAQTSSRLIAQSDYSHDGAMFKAMDSTSFMYGSDLRGGDVSHTQKFDNSTMYYYQGDSMYVNNVYTTQDFDANNNISSTTTQYWSGTAWVLSSRTLYTYTSGNKIATRIDQYWGGTSWTPSTKNIYTYDAKGMLQLDQYQIWNGLTSKFDNYSTRTYTYDGVSGKLLNETDQDVYSGSPVYTQQYVYTYTTDTQLLTTTYATWSSGWVNVSMYTNTYDMSRNRTSQLYQTYNTGTSAWENVTYMIYSSFTGAHMPQSQIDQYWNTSSGGSWVNQMQHTYTYNSNNQMTTSIGKSWNIVGVFEYAAGDPMARYYYGTYGTTMNVNNVVSENGTANMFPVPASNMLHIDLKWNAAQASTIAIYDMTGRMVTPLMEVPSVTEFHTALSVNMLAAGNYIVKINGENGQIVKNIVVAN